jgi:hypothetical protein
LFSDSSNNFLTVSLLLSIVDIVLFLIVKLEQISIANIATTGFIC